MKDDRKFPQDHGTQAIISYYDCGCTVSIVVVDGNEQEAYKRAAQWAKEGEKKGTKVKTVDLGEWKEEQGIYCTPEHKESPPWGKPKAKAPQATLGL